MTRVYNRLINEQSPYLLQHAHNPVDWYPWSDEAFEKAKNEDKPIFLSIGYSTCHWCHVMERESFEDPEIAELMNNAFVCIKVDREERPDLDNIYMKVSQILTGSGGWPLNVLLTPEKKPFFAATYIPPDSYLNRMGMKDFVPAIVEMWKQKRDYLLTSAEETIKWLNKDINLQANIELDVEILDTTFWELYAEFDQNYGGFGGTPKFPCVNNLLFLLRYWKRNGDERALSIVEKSLKSMRLGGIYDHIGFGFHRYATDAKWLLPHFEKMLYDQAMLIILYSEAFQATKDPFYSQTVKEIIRYVFRHLADNYGGFYSGEDADSEGEEGKFYLWQEDELQELLDQDEFRFIKNVFNTAEDGNYLDESIRKKTGKNILHMNKPLLDMAKDYNLSEEAFQKTIGDIRRKLFSRRSQRIPPHIDDKVLTDWNGLMIAALSIAYQVLGEHKYLKRAQKAADFILSKMIDNNGKLLHRYRKGEASINAFVDDYSFLIFALIELYEASFETKYLEKAFELMDEQLDNFWDDENGGFFFTSHDSEALIARKKEISESSIPSANSISLYNLLRLGRMSSDSNYEQKARDLIDAFSVTVKRYPSAFTHFLSSLDFAFDSVKEIVIAGDLYSSDTKEMILAIRSLYIPNKIVLVKSDNEDDFIQKKASFTKYQNSLNKKSTAYVCLNYSCKNPTVEIEEMMELLNK